MTMEIGETTTAQPFTGAGSRGAPQLETVMHLMWDRIESLEADRRSLRRMIALGLAAVVLIAGVLGAIFTHGGRNPRDLAVTDGAGRVRARLGIDSHSGATTLQLLDAEGHTQAILAAEAAGPALSFYDRNGTAKLRLGLASKSPILDVVDAKGRPCAPATLGCRRNDARARFFGSAG